MKKHLLFDLILTLIVLQTNAQGIFDASIHTAVGFGIVNSPIAESPQQIIDQDPNTKFLDFNIDDGMGFDVDLLGVMHVASSIRIVTANDAPERDPTMFEIFGSTDGTNYTSIFIGEIPCVAERFLPRSFGFVNTAAYSFYRVNFTGTCGTSTINQVADVQLFPIIGNAPMLECPADITVGNSAGECGAILEYTAMATDTEDGTLSADLTSGIASGELFPIGTSAVVLSVMDSDNNAVSCNFTVTVMDTENPTFTCPNDIIVPVSNLDDSTTIIDFDLGIMDNCSVINPITGYTSIGTIDGRSYYLSDSLFTPAEAFAEAVLQGGMVGAILNEDENDYLLAGILRNNNGIADILIGLNDAQYEGLYVWPDDTQPNYTNWNTNEPNNAGAGGVPENFTIMLTSGFWNDVDSFGIRKYLLQVDYVPIQTQGLSSGSAFPLGNTTNSFVIYDAAGNTMTCDFNVTVEEPLNVFDEELSKNISISPNPTTDNFTLHNQSDIVLENAMIYNMQGKMVQQVNIKQAIEYQTFDISSLASGMYFVKIKGENGIASKKIIKL